MLKAETRRLCATRSTVRRTGSMLLLVLSMLAFSASADTRWYQVEIIVFKQKHSSTTNPEPLPDNAILPDSTDAVKLNYTGDTRYRLGGTVAFRLLGQRFYAMKSLYSKLSRSSYAYRPVAHIAWRQPTKYGRNGFRIEFNAGPVFSKPGQPAATTPTPAANTPGTAPKKTGRDTSQYGEDNDEASGQDEKPMIRDDSDKSKTVEKKPEVQPTPVVQNKPVHEISGTITISRLRYLHVDVDLAYHKADPGNTQNPKGYHVYRMKQTRRMKSKEVHFIDHPMFGMLVYFHPLDAKKHTAPGK